MKTLRRRRRENKTDYSSRLSLLKSEKPRVAIRKSNNYITAQIIESDVAQDKVIVSANSKELLTLGWPKEKSGSLKSLPAAYLTGLLLAKKSKGKIKEAILDMGLYRNIPGSRIYAALKGIIDGGIKIPHSKESIPSEERLNSNKSLKGVIDKIREKM